MKLRTKYAKQNTFSITIYLKHRKYEKQPVINLDFIISKLRKQ